MSNFNLGYQNSVFQGGTLTLEAGTLSVGLLSALQDQRLSNRVTITAVSVAGGLATLRFRWNPASGTVPVALMGLLNYAVSAPGAASVTVSLTATGGATSYSENATWSRPSADFLLHAWALCVPQIAATVVTVEVTASFGGAGETLSLTAGALWASRVWSPPQGIEATWAQTVVDRGMVGRSEGNQGYPRPRQRYRSFEGRSIQVPFAYAFGDPADTSIMDIQQLLFLVGSTNPVVLFPRTQDEDGDTSVHVMHRLGIYGHFAELGRIEHTGANYFQWTGCRVDELM